MHGLTKMALLTVFQELLEQYFFRELAGRVFPSEFDYAHWLLGGDLNKINNLWKM